MLLALYSGLSLNPADVAVLEWDRRHYANASTSTLVITMKSGTQHRIEHVAGIIDAHAIERRILAAAAATT